MLWMFLAACAPEGTDPAVDEADACAAVTTVCEGDYTLDGTAGFVNVSDCAEITGDVVIQTPGEDLAGLECLTIIGGTLTIQHSDSLRTLTGLSGLAAVGEAIDIIDNDALVDTGSFPALTTIGEEPA